MKLLHAFNFDDPHARDYGIGKVRHCWWGEIGHEQTGPSPKDAAAYAQSLASAAPLPVVIESGPGESWLWNAAGRLAPLATVKRYGECIQAMHDAVPGLLIGVYCTIPQTEQESIAGYPIVTDGKASDCATIRRYVPIDFSVSCGYASQSSIVTSSVATKLAFDLARNWGRHFRFLVPFIHNGEAKTTWLGPLEFSAQIEVALNLKITPVLWCDRPMPDELIGVARSYA